MTGTTEIIARSQEFVADTGMVNPRSSFREGFFWLLGLLLARKLQLSAPSGSASATEATAFLGQLIPHDGWKQG